MQTPKPFKARNIRYDAEGNIVILPWGEDEVCHAERSAAHRLRSPAARSAQDDRSGTLRQGSGQAATKHALSFSILRDRLRSGIHLPSLHFSLPKLPHLPHLPKFSRKFTTHASPRVRLAWNAASFGGRFVGIFLLLFVSLNARSYWQVGRAALLPGADTQSRQALEVITERKLLAVPELPRAGRNRKESLPARLTVSPPDNRLIIPKIGKNVPLISVSDAALRREDWKTFEKDIQEALLLGVVRYPGTAAPGEPGNVFLTGHSSNYPWIFSKYNSVLALLPKLDIGDEYSLYFNGTLHRYRIVKRFEVSPKDVSVLEQPQDRRMSTLMTCTPIGTTLRRLILQADEIDPETGTVLAVSEDTRRETSAAPEWGAELPI